MPADSATATTFTPSKDYWDIIKAVKIGRFKYLENIDIDDDHLGVDARQVKEIAEELTTPWDDDLVGLRSADMNFALMKALQEAMARIEELEKTVKFLEERRKLQVKINDKIISSIEEGRRFV